MTELHRVISMQDPDPAGAMSGANPRGAGCA